MLMAASSLLRANDRPTQDDVEAALGGVLCRCTGYRKIVDAVLDVGNRHQRVVPATGHAVGARIAKLDGASKLTGAEEVGADAYPAASLGLRAVRPPHASARFSLGSFDALKHRHPGLVLVLTAADVPRNAYGIYPDIKDQPVLAEGHVRYRGEAVLALVGDRATLEGISDRDLPITWEPLPPLIEPNAALAASAPVLQ